MKKISVILLLTFTVICMQAQNYLINFIASGTTTSLDSIYVENITQGNSLLLLPNDTLSLSGTSDVLILSEQLDFLKIYPNPFDETSTLEFYSEVPSIARITVYDATGNLIMQKNQKIEKSINVFEISGFAKGYYQVIIASHTQQIAAAFVSFNTKYNYPQIILKSSFFREQQAKQTKKSTKNIVQMPYNSGEQMLYIGFSGGLSELIIDVPTLTKTINFIFSSSSCGGIITDIRDANQYASVQIGNQCWMSENLKYLPSVTGPNSSSTTTPYYYVYGYNGTDVNAAKTTTNYANYGVLYNWRAAMNGASSSSTNPSGVQGICPLGWHIPSDAEFTQLINFLGGISVAGGKLKETGTIHWLTPNLGATNESGFTALPGGFRNQGGGFFNLTATGHWWSTTIYSSSSAWYHFLDYNGNAVFKNAVSWELGYSVRCIKD